MNKHMKRLGVWSALLAIVALLVPTAVFADAVVGDTVVTLGADLS